MHKLPTVRGPESAIKGRETYQTAVVHRRRDRLDYKRSRGIKCDAVCPREISEFKLAAAF